MQLPLGITTGIHTEKQFRDLVIRQSNGAIVRLGDVAKVELGSDNYLQSVRFNGEPSVFVQIAPAPEANVLDVVSRVKARISAIRADLPQGLTVDVAYDASTDIEQSIREVAKTLLASLGIVTLVVFAFLRSARASIIPVVTIPLSRPASLWTMRSSWWKTCHAK